MRREDEKKAAIILRRSLERAKKTERYRNEMKCRDNVAKLEETARRLEEGSYTDAGIGH